MISLGGIGQTRVSGGGVRVADTRTRFESFLDAENMPDGVLRDVLEEEGEIAILDTIHVPAK
jgi:hypothetical protein